MLAWFYTPEMINTEVYKKYGTLPSQSSKLRCQKWLPERLKLVNYCQVVEEGLCGWVSRCWRRGGA